MKKAKPTYAQLEAEIARLRSALAAAQELAKRIVALK